MTEKRFNWDWKTGRWKDTQSDSLATKNPRILETMIDEACLGYEKEIEKLSRENRRFENFIQRLWDIAEENGGLSKGRVKAEIMTFRGDYSDYKWE